MCEAEIVEFTTMASMINEAGRLEAMLERAKEVHDLEEQFAIQDRLGMCLSRQSVDDAVRWLEAAFYTAHLLDDDWKKWVVYHNLGTVYRSMNQTEKCIAYDEKCLELAKEMGSHALEAIAWFNLASGFHLMTYLKKANKFYAMASKIISAAGDETKGAHVSLNMDLVKIFIKREAKKKEEAEALRQKEINKKKRQQGLLGKGK